MPELDQCTTQEDILTVMLGEVREMRASFEERFTLLEKYLGKSVVRPIEKLQYDLSESNANIRFLVDAYKNLQQRQTLSEVGVGPKTPLAVVVGDKGSKGGNDVG